MATKTTNKEPEPSFETAMERLEQIVEVMESGELPLEELISRYEEGVKLVKSCEERLKAAEGRIEIIARHSRGEPQIEPFEPAKAAEPPSIDKIPDPQREDVSLF